MMFWRLRWTSMNLKVIVADLPASGRQIKLKASALKAKRGDGMRITDSNWGSGSHSSSRYSWAAGESHQEPSWILFPAARGHLTTDIVFLAGYRRGLALLIRPSAPSPTGENPGGRRLPSRLRR